MSINEVLVATYSQVPVTSIDGLKLAVDWSKMNAETIAHLAWHGLKQKANDPNGAKDLSDSAKQGNSEKVIAAFEANEVRRTSDRIADPIEAELSRRLVAIISTAIINKGGKLKDYKMADLRAKADEFKTKYPEKTAAIRAKVVADHEEQAAFAVEL
jgi:hypothetical protein